MRIVMQKPIKQWVVVFITVINPVYDCERIAL